MHNHKPSKNSLHNISAIDKRLAELDREKHHLLVLKQKLQKAKVTSPIPESFSAEQKVTIFRKLFRGRTDIFANRWQNQQGRSGYSVACNNDKTAGKSFCTALAA